MCAKNYLCKLRRVLDKCPSSVARYACDDDADHGRHASVVVYDKAQFIGIMRSSGTGLTPDDFKNFMCAARPWGFSMPQATAPAGAVCLRHPTFTKHSATSDHAVTRAKASKSKRTTTRTGVGAAACSPRRASEDHDADVDDSDSDSDDNKVVTAARVAEQPPSKRLRHEAYVEHPEAKDADGEVARLRFEIARLKAKNARLEAENVGLHDTVGRLLDVMSPVAEFLCEEGPVPSINEAVPEACGSEECGPEVDASEGDGADDDASEVSLFLDRCPVEPPETFLAADDETLLGAVIRTHSSQPSLAATPSDAGSPPVVAGVNLLHACSPASDALYRDADEWGGGSFSASPLT